MTFKECSTAPRSTIYMYIHLNHTLYYHFTVFQVKASDVRKIVRCILLNVTLITVPYTVLHYILHHLRGSDMTFTVPPFKSLLLDVLLSALLDETAFYYSHRLVKSI